MRTDAPPGLPGDMWDDAVPDHPALGLPFERSPAPMWVFDRDTLRFLAVNDAAVRAYGWSREEFLAMTILDIRPPDDRTRVRAELAAAARGEPVERTWRHVARDGTLRWVDVAWADLAWEDRPARMVLALDVTEARLARAALARSQAELAEARAVARGEQVQKAESVARLAAGMAHDFNNLLTAIRCSADLLADALPEPDERRADVDDIRDAADRAAALTRQLLGFARQQVVEPRVLDLNALVTEYAAVLQDSLPEEVEQVLLLEPAVGHVRADRDQLQQVLLALAMNARDAMPDGGALLIQTANAELDAGTVPAARGGNSITPGRYVLLGVSDTGVGMEPEVQARMFEPFFTTKEPGKGTGLGLASVYGIVKQAGGFIWARSLPGRGTRFTVYLPRVDEVPEPVQAPEPPSDADVRGDETVLVVEDEPLILELASRVLRGHGYQVLPAADGEAALAAAAAHAGPVHLLLTDVVMPRMGGPALADRLRAVRPATRVLYMSGYTEGDIVRQRVLQRGVQLIGKPFTPRELAERVRRVLDA